jgi:hypothetical protein
MMPKMRKRVIGKMIAISIADAPLSLAARSLVSSPARSGMRARRDSDVPKQIATDWRWLPGYWPLPVLLLRLIECALLTTAV